MKLLITAGPTREPIDDVRFISNRSSGQMGVALTQAAADAGHRVTLLLGPVLALASFEGDVEVVRFTTTAELETLLGEHFVDCDVLVMAAAVADYRLATPRTGKAPRSEGMRLELEPTPDLVAGVAATKRDDQRVIAFALEEAAVMEDRAVQKMKRKGVDAIVANPLATMDAQRVAAVVLTAEGQRFEPPATAGDGTDGPGQSKLAFARWLIAWLTPR
ncbi:MAG: phosphopantothenoylcysteine decarboxylase [Algisphaera sp.]